MDGYPGVSYVAPKTGAQVGAAAGRGQPSFAYGQVVLQPGGFATATVKSLGNPQGRCPPATAAGFRVYPPNNTVAAYAPFPQPYGVCANGAGTFVYPVVAGTAGRL